jgi:hypothetical protein
LVFLVAGNPQAGYAPRRAPTMGSDRTGEPLPDHYPTSAASGDRLRCRRSRNVSGIVARPFPAGSGRRGNLVASNANQMAGRGVGTPMRLSRCVVVGPTETAGVLVAAFARGWQHSPSSIPPDSRQLETRAQLSESVIFFPRSPLVIATAVAYTSSRRSHQSPQEARS